MWIGFLTALALSLLPSVQGAPAHRAAAVLTAVLAAGFAGPLLGRWAGLGLGLALGTFHLVVRELFGPADETYLPMIVLYLCILGGVARLSALIFETLGASWENSAALERELADSERRQQVVLLMSRVGAELSSHSSDSEPVKRALADLCAALELDVIIVRRNEAGDDGPISTIESWITRSGADDDIAINDGTFEWRTLPSMAECLASGWPFAFSGLDELSDPDRITLSSGSARLESVLNIPVMDGDRWLGHTALATRAKGRDWSEADVASLSILAEMLANAWRRDRQTAELVSVIEARELAIRQQAALTEGTRLLLTHELENPLSRTLSLVMTALDGDVSYVEMFEMDEELGMVSRPIEHLYKDPATKVESVVWPLSSSPIAAQQYLSGRPNVFASPREEAENDPDHVEHYEDAALSAECNYPIIIEGQTIGFVGVGTFAERSWSADDRSVMHSFALMLGSFLERETAMRKLEDLVSAKDRFIGAVSHELRTPLAVVVGLAAELADNDQSFTPEERREFLGMIRRQSTEVSDIIDDLLVSTRISETGLTVIAETFELDDLARAVLRDLPDDVTRKIVDVDLTPTAVVADPLRTRQIVRNLITNAHRYGGEHISIAVRAEADRTILAVADDGDGVPEERRAEIFEAYHTSGGERIVTAAIGLGLTVSRQLARLMGGDVTYVHSDHPRFELELRSVAAVGRPIDPHAVSSGA